jgi:hypothetical protein
MTYRLAFEATTKLEGSRIRQPLPARKMLGCHNCCQVFGFRHFAIRTAPEQVASGNSKAVVVQLRQIPQLHRKLARPSCSFAILCSRLASSCSEEGYRPLALRHSHSLGGPPCKSVLRVEVNSAGRWRRRHRV